MTEKSETRKILEQKFAELAETEEEKTDEKEEVKDEVEELNFSSLPKSFRLEMAELFGQLPEEMQKYLHEKDKEDEQKFAELQRKIDEKKWIDEICEHHMSRLQKCGINDVQKWLKNITDIDEALECNPQAMLSILFDVYGGGVPTNSDKEATPEEDKMQDAWRIVGGFMQAADDEGNVRYPYADIVKEQMAGLLKCGASRNLEDAYEKAIWLDGRIRTKLIKEKAEAVLKEKALEAEKAKQAGFAPKGRLSQADMSKLSTRELLQRLMDQ